jgi:hypothetical protein
MVKNPNSGLEALAPKNLYNHNVRCYELHMVMCQNNTKFDPTHLTKLERSHIQIDINKLNNMCSRVYEHFQIISKYMKSKHHVEILNMMNYANFMS